MIKEKLSKDAREAYDMALLCEGVELRTDWPIYEELEKSGLCDFGPARGPGGAWVRIWPKELPEEERCP